VVFSDKTKINCFNANGRSWCWVNDKESLPDRAVKQTVKHGGRSIMLWNCMTSRGLGNLQRVEGRIYAKDYIALLHGVLYLSLERLTPKALWRPNFGRCCFGQVLVKRRCDRIFWEFYGK
jgi:hypothetical protein